MGKHDAQHRRHNICSGIFRRIIGPYDSISFDNGYYYRFQAINHMNVLSDPLMVAVLKTSARR